MREYLITRGGVELTVQLSDADAKRMGARPVGSKKPATKGKEPANKAAAPDNK